MMFAQKVKIKLYEGSDCSGSTLGTIELSCFDTSKALTMLEDVIRPAYNEIGLGCSFKIEIVDYDI
jgi:hypothetical protein